MSKFEKMGKEVKDSDKKGEDEEDQSQSRDGKERERHFISAFKLLYQIAPSSFPRPRSLPLHLHHSIFLLNLLPIFDAFHTERVM